MTNFEKIKNMNIDEMEEFLCKLCTDVVMSSIVGESMKSPNKKWLESEAEESRTPEIFCNPDICPNCQYIGEGDSICDVTMKIVLDDWAPTDDFMENCPFMNESE